MSPSPRASWRAERSATSSRRSSTGNVPNPILIGDYTGRGIAFNLADLFTFFGILALTVSLVVVTIRHRDRLLPPRAWERRIWEKLGL